MKNNLVYGFLFLISISHLTLADRRFFNPRYCDANESCAAVVKGEIRREYIYCKCYNDENCVYHHDSQPDVCIFMCKRYTNPGYYASVKKLLGESFVTRPTTPSPSSNEE